MILYNKFWIIQIYILHQNEYLQVLARQERIVTHDLLYNGNVTVHGIKITFKQILDTDDELTNNSIKACNQEGFFCWVKRAKKLNAVLQTSQEHNYDEIRTLNYNNDIFDQISNVAEVNIESVSSIIESNDIIPRADIVSSDDSSSTKQLGDGYENPYQAINPCDIEMHHYSSIINDNYQNTMIFSSESATNTPQHFNVAMNSFRQPSN
ncbi:unnamed protein product [Mytilus coruscus]|uniref:Uncharacterized protein n=1 Tax=Mytilus coruscus TaxID=42192 RepID=A0A6J8CCD2_MYTCO|nr:unnamed protein product [Mytilus coruscus]